MIPDKNLFIVTSSIKPKIGVFSPEQRFAQTLFTLRSIRKKVPDAIILLSDTSISPLSDFEKKVLSQNSNLYFDLSEEPATKHYTSNGQKSHAENALLFATLQTLKNNPNVSNVLNSVKRVFKFSGRSELDDNFNINDYDDLFGKFVFKKRIPTWMGDIKHDATHLFITRMYSFCPSLIDTYLSVLNKNMSIVNVLDTEHAHFVNIPKNYLVEFEKIHCMGWLAGNGEIEHY